MRYFIFLIFLFFISIINANTPTQIVYHSTTTQITKTSTPSRLLVTNDLWQYINNHAIMDHQHPSIDYYVDWFKNRSAYLTRISKRAKWYLHYIVTEVEKRNMPIEIALLPAVESAFYPFAFSPQRAAGLWQFIPSTGLSYGLSQTWWYDARRDVVASTNAALQYLKNLHILFDGDWLLAISAYNAGPGRVQKAIKKNKELNKPIDFWHLDLPLETKSYVPKLLAILRIIKNPTFYQQQLAPIDNQPRVIQVDLRSQLDIRAISQLSGLPIEFIYELNPGLKRWATPPVSHYQLLLPIESAIDFTKKLAYLPLSEQLEWVRYEIAKGEKISDIAKTYNLQTKQLTTINFLAGFDINNSDFIIVPILKQHISFHALNEKQQQERLARQRASDPIIYTVKPKDSLLSIALLHEVSLSDLALWNNIANVNKIRIGQKIYITQHHQLNVEIAKAGVNTRMNITRKILYQIRRNDTLSVLAERFGVSIAQIMQWNKLESVTIKYGENLIFYINIVQ